MIRPLFVCFVVWVSIPNWGHADEPNAQMPIRARIEAMRNTGAATLVVGDLTLAKAVAEFYEHHNFALMWTSKKRLQQLIAAIESTADDGLNPDDYHLNQLRHGLEHFTNNVASGEHIDFDLLATDAYLRALIHLFRGKVDPKSLDPRWNFLISDVAPARALRIVIDGVDQDKIGDVFALARPRHALYTNMRGALIELHALAARGGWPELPEGPVLKPEMHDTRVPALRQRLAAAGLAVGADDTGDLYSGTLVAATKQFQREQLEQADGVIGTATRTALNISIQQRIEQLRADLERARWLLHGVHDNFLLVNAGSYKVGLYHGDTAVWNARVQVGMPARDTPIFKSKITHVTFNPNWTVPPTIFTKDILPKIRRDPTYLAANKIRVFNGREQLLNPAQVDWNNPGGIILRQDAGPHGALGRAAIRFGNPYSIYLHDTPHQELFSSSQRNFSSGCIRVERALELVELLLDDKTVWNSTTIAEVIATEKTRNVNLPHPLPILLTYWTVEVLGGGHIAFKPDAYARNEELLKALNARDSY
jgi:murein L,D-transpeptidase YcbB/YkuD